MWLGLLPVFFFFPGYTLFIPRFSPTFSLSAGYRASHHPSSARAGCRSDERGRWWCEVLGCSNCHRWQRDKGGQRVVRLILPNFQKPAYTAGKKTLQQCDLEEKITDDVNTEERSRRLGVTTVLRRTETEKLHRGTVGRTDLSVSQLRCKLAPQPENYLYYV